MLSLELISQALYVLLVERVARRTLITPTRWRLLDAQDGTGFVWAALCSIAIVLPMAILIRLIFRGAKVTGN